VKFVLDIPIFEFARSFVHRALARELLVSI